MSIAVSARANAVMMALAVALAGGPAAAHHVGVFVPRDNEVSANFKQIKFALQARKFDVALRLFDNGALRAEMRARAADLPAGLEAATRGAIGAGDVPAAERWLMVFFAALARDLAREADRRLADPGGSAEARGAVGRKFLEAITRYYSWNSVSCAEFMRTTKFHKYYFSNQPDSRMQANGLAKYIVDKMGKRTYIFYTDYAMGQSDGRQFKTALEKLGGEVVGVARAPLDTKDFSPWFGAINQANPDVLFVAFAGTDSLRLMTQLHSFGMTKKYKLAGIDCFLLQQDLPAIAEPMEGFIQLAHFSAYNPDKSMQAFNAKFKKRFGLLGVMNFAHGEFYMFGAYAGIAVVGVTQSFWVALIAAPLLVAAIGAVTEVAALRPLYRREPLYGLVMTFGLVLAFREGARQLFGGNMRRILPPIEGSIPLLGMTYPRYRLFLLAFSSLLLLAIWLFFTRTRAGIIVRAAVQDAEMLDGLGVNVPRVFTLTFAGSAALAALAGLLLAPVFTVYPQMGGEMILLAFIVVILGGMGSMGGSVVAAFVIGITQSLLTLWMKPQRVAIAIFGIMIVVLIVRPRGFFGREGVLE